jgi:hypothetical protein
MIGGGGIGGLLGGGGGGLGKLLDPGGLLKGLFGGGKCKKKKGQIKQLKQMVGALAQQVQGLKQQMAHQAGFQQGMMAGLGMKGMNPMAGGQLATASFQGFAAGGCMPGMSMGFSQSISMRFG